MVKNLIFTNLINYSVEGFQLIEVVVEHQFSSAADIYKINFTPNS
jgi:hypothetical protein